MILAASILLAISLIAITSVFIRHFRDLAILNINTVAEERIRKMKERLTLERFTRASAAVKKTVQGWFAPVGGAVRRGAFSIYEKVMLLEKRYQEERRKMHRPVGSSEQAKVSALVEEGSRYAKEKRYPDAEQKFIAAISFDNKNVGAYLGLLEVYLHLEQLEEARETAQFLLKLKPGDMEVLALRGEVALKMGDSQAAEDYFKQASSVDDSVLSHHFRLAEIYEESGKHREAMEEMQKLVKKEPANPKYLDFLIETSILSGDSASALEALSKLKAANPENKKIAEFEEKIAKM